MKLNSLAHRLLSKPSKILDQIGGLGLRIFLYRQNVSFDPEINGEHWFLNELKKNLNIVTVADIGANEGRWTSKVRNTFPDAKVAAIEPMPQIYSRLEKRFSADNCVTVHGIAIGDEDKTIKAHENLEQSSHSYVGEGDIDVQAISGKNLLKRLTFDHLDLCKIDTEGFDLKIIMSMEPLFTNVQISVLQFEHYKPSLNYGVDICDVVKMLRSKGYKIGKIYPNSIKWIDDELGWEFIGPNFIAIHSRYKFC